MEQQHNVYLHDHQEQTFRFPEGIVQTVSRKGKQSGKRRSRLTSTTCKGKHSAARLRKQHGPIVVSDSEDCSVRRKPSCHIRCDARNEADVDFFCAQLLEWIFEGDVEPRSAYQGARMVHLAEESDQFVCKSAIDSFFHSARRPLDCCALPETKTSTLHTSGLYMYKVKDSYDDDIQTRPTEKIHAEPVVAPQMFMKKMKHFFDDE